VNQKKKGGIGAGGVLYSQLKSEQKNRNGKKAANWPWKKGERLWRKYINSLILSISKRNLALYAGEKKSLERTDRKGRKKGRKKKRGPPAQESQ